MSGAYYTYVLKSKRDGHLYVGCTSDLSKRIEAHNKGKVRSTKSRRPLNLVYYEEYQDKTSARKREIFLKSGQGRFFLKAKLEPQALANDRIGPQVA
jgi:putative endonuclease